MESQVGIRIEITEPTFRNWPRIPLRREHRPRFPGYKLPFILDADGESFVVHVTSRNGPAQEGDPNAGKYICVPLGHEDRGRLGDWYGRHPELQVGDTLVFEVVEPLGPMKRYKLSILDA